MMKLVQRDRTSNRRIGPSGKSLFLDELVPIRPSNVFTQGEKKELFGQTDQFPYLDCNKNKASKASLACSGVLGRMGSLKVVKGTDALFSVPGIEGGVLGKEREMEGGRVGRRGWREGREGGVEYDGVEEVAFAAVTGCHEGVLKCRESVVDRMVDGWVDEDGVNWAVEEPLHSSWVETVLRSVPQKWPV